MNETKTTTATVTVIGGGLAGSEAAYYLASRGISVTLVDMKPSKFTPAHESANFGELVCSNSLKSNDAFGNACGLLKEEMRLIGSLTMEAAEHSRVPAGSALAVDRDKFSAYITAKLRSLETLTIEEREVESLPEVVQGGNEYVIVATGPLTTGKLFESISEKTGKQLHFYDASAPIVATDSIDMEKAFVGDRYGNGVGDYLNAPMDKETYYAFVQELINADKAILHDFEKGEIFEGCMPIEVMAARGADTLRYGTLKPIGLGDRQNPPYAVVQMRKENEHGEAYNLVGFQTNLKFPEQKRVFSMIPALKNAEYLRYGVMHRNTYIHAPSVLNGDFSVKNNQNLLFAGQITGVEGYVESAASGLLAAMHLADRLLGLPKKELNDLTVSGALEKHVSTETADFQPMNANFGIVRPLNVRIKNKKDRYRALAERALEEMKRVLKTVGGEGENV